MWMTRFVFCFFCEWGLFSVNVSVYLCYSVCVCLYEFTPYLFLILVLQPQPLLDAVAGLQEDFPLGALGEDPHKHPRQVDAGEQHRVGHQLHTNKHRHAKHSW